MENAMKKNFVGLCLVVALFATQDAVYAGRYYTPEIARWATPDPALREKLANELVEIHNGMLLSTSPYAYTYNNPLKYTDPDGKIPTIAIGALSGAALDLGLQVATNYVQGRSLTDISWKQVAISAGLGAAGAGLASKAGQLFRLASKADDVVNLADDATRGVTKLADEVSGLADDATRQGGKSFTKGQVEQFQRQLTEHGKSSLEKSRATFEKRLNEHLKKLEEYKKAGGRTSSVEREIRNFRQQLEAIDEVLKGAQ
jgi:RHS repeat-associated protein